MTDKERCNELALQIKELKARLKVLEEEYKKLNSEINAKHEKELPYQFTTGRYSLSKKGMSAIYWNYSTKTYYCKPLYRPNGTPYGMKVTKKDIISKKEVLEELGFVEKI